MHCLDLLGAEGSSESEGFGTEDRVEGLDNHRLERKRQSQWVWPGEVLHCLDLLLLGAERSSESEGFG